MRGYRLTNLSVRNGASPAAGAAAQASEHKAGRKNADSEPQGKPTANGQSAKDIVDEKSVGKIPPKGGSVEGPNGERHRMVR